MIFWNLRPMSIRNQKAQEIQENDKILFKGSRGMKMEKIISGVFEA